MGKPVVVLLFSFKTKRFFGGGQICSHLFLFVLCFYLFVSYIVNEILENCKYGI